MLPKENRLRKMKDFDILFKEGEFVSGRFLIVKYWKIDPEKYPKRDYSKEDLKIGFVVGKKVHKGAVKRNRIKRQMREVVYPLLKQNKIKNAYFVAILAKPEIVGVEYGKIEQDIINTLKKISILL